MKLNKISESSGRILFIDESGTIYKSLGLSIYISNNLGQSWKKIFTIENITYNIISKSNLLSRLLRNQILRLEKTDYGIYVIYKDGIYSNLNSENNKLTKIFSINNRSRPIHISKDSQHRIFFGDYGNNKERNEIKLWGTIKDRYSFEEVYRFAKGDIRHVHNILYDKFINKFWIFTGDYGHEPGIAVFDLKTGSLEWIYRGEQKYRVVSAIITENSLIFGTDTELEKNQILRLDKKSFAISTLTNISGSSLNSVRIGAHNYVSTCVEPSQINITDKSYLYSSTDLINWTEILSFKKDDLSPRFFQYGDIILPYSDYEKNDLLVISGQSLLEIDNKVFVYKIVQE